MLSSLSNLLPSLSNDSASRNQQPPAPADVGMNSQAPRRSVDEPPTRPSRLRVQNETFIVVRPPPSKSNHPLNLQLQLIPPAIGPAHTKGSSQSGHSSRRSVDFTRTDTVETLDSPPGSEAGADGQQLQRRNSISSTRSADSASLYSNSSSVASTSSSASSRRIIVPLYNLSAHNVMTNAVLDAGTDAKIAKFLKRGLEIIDLCVIEPTEMWGNTTGLPQDVSTPDNDSVVSSEHPHVPAPEPVVANAATTKRPRFTSFFNRKASPAPPEQPPTPKPAAAPTAAAKREQQLSQPVLGLQSSIYSAVYPPVGRSPASIVWVVRRWIKGGDSGLLGAMQRLNVKRGGENTAAQTPTVRFEWVRGLNSAARKDTLDSGHGHAKAATVTEGVAGSRRSSRIVPAASGTGTGSRSHSPAPKSVDLASSSHEGDARSESLAHGSDDESDAEDSETPWTCTLVISLPGDVSPSPSDLSVNRQRNSVLSTSDAHLAAAAPRKALRLRVATLAPTPHHPKVVAQLKMPWPLPDVDVVHGIAHKRAPTGGSRSANASLAVPEDRAPGAVPGLIVTAEELKDIVCTSAFWMIVRENFGGISRKTRKGDGWNIRG